MCKVYNSVGCLTTVKAHLKRHGINDFNSLNEVIEFQRSYSSLKQQVIQNSKQLIEKERIILSAEIQELDQAIKDTKRNLEHVFRSEIEELSNKISSLSISTGLGFIQKFFNYMKRRSLNRILKNLELSLNDRVSYSINNVAEKYKDKTNRYNYINTHYFDAVNEMSLNEINRIEYKKRVIAEVENSIYGAIGEHKVVKELEKLSDENILINDFAIQFHPAIYNRLENDYIKSIQIDHLLVTPSGIFLIETKNWSEKSMASLDLRSPVKQVKRTNFAIFKILNEHIASGRISINQHHWGDQKIPIRNLIVLINSKPSEEFQFVKVLMLNELVNYINYFKPIFSNEETKSIAHYFLQRV